jgi:hypothetical protein
VAEKADNIIPVVEVVVDDQGKPVNDVTRDTATQDLTQARAAADKTAAEHLAKQVAALRDAELHQLNAYQAQQHERYNVPTDLDGRLKHWRMFGGLSEENEKFMRDNPDLVHRDDLTRIAAAIAHREGHQPET